MNEESKLVVARSKARGYAATHFSSERPPSKITRPTMFLRERATASPSVAIEKGGHRMHGRTTRLEQIRLRGPTKLRTESKASATAQKSLKYDRRISILLLFCALAAVSCFSAAYWLFVTGKRGMSSPQTHVGTPLIITSSSLGRSLPPNAIICASIASYCSASCYLT